MVELVVSSTNTKSHLAKKQRKIPTEKQSSVKKEGVHGRSSVHQNTNSFLHTC